MMYDAIVIGAGPAGATAAYQLARRNCRVLVLEKARLPRYKPCGGGLTGRVMPMLDFDISATVEDEARRVVLSYDGGPAVSWDFGHTAVTCVMRDKFDYILARKAVEAGAELQELATVDQVHTAAGGVTVRTPKGSYQAQYVVGADGATGITAKSVGLMANRTNGVALEAEIEVASSALERWRNTLLIDFGGIPWGYSWIFPKAEHLSVGVGTWSARARLNLRGYLERFVERQPDLREGHTLLTKGHLVPLGGRSGRFHRDRVVLAGDAAATVDPLTGEGISHAIHSGRIAADVIATALYRGDTNLAEHTRMINREINSDFRYARLGTHIFYRWPLLSYRLFIQGGGLLDNALTVVEGSGSYRKLLLTTLSRVPAALWCRLRPLRQRQ